MINARESLDLLLSSDKLDGLLAAARTKAAKLDAKRPHNVSKQASELEQQVAEARALGSQASKGLRDVLAAKHASRTEKVAIVRHLLHFGSKLVNA